MNSYRENLIRTYNVLLNLHERLFTRIINVEMAGDLQQISKCFEVGDTYFFQIEQFRNSTDQNVQLLLALYDSLEDSMNSLANRNAITEDELEAIAEEDEDDIYYGS